jgi:hypothetical protein
MYVGDVYVCDISVFKCYQRDASPHNKQPDWPSIILKVKTRNRKKKNEMVIMVCTNSYLWMKTKNGRYLIII